MPDKQDKERPEDLNPTKDEELEARVHRMLDPNLPDEDEELATAPEVKKPKPKKIAVSHHADEKAASKKKKVADKDTDADTAPPVPKDLQKTIEQTNAELAAQVTPKPEDEENSKAEAIEELGKVATDEVTKPAEPITQTTNAEDDTKPADEFDDEVTGKAIDEITAEESDELLFVQDEQQAIAENEVTKEPSRFKAIVRDLLHSRGLRWVVFLLLFGVVAAAGVFPNTRYYALNAMGVRSSASVQVIDQSTLQPLKDVQVQVGDRSATTDSEGMVRFADLKLGTTGLTIQKRAFAPVHESIVLGWGSNPLGSRNLTPVGSQYMFVVTDFLSGKPIAKVAATSGEADAQSDDKGQIKLTMDHSNDSEVTVTISAKGYREEKINLDLTSKQVIPVKMVPVRKEVFVSKRSGTYDVYKVDVDGKNETLVLKGTGNERDDLVLVPHPTEELVALVSTRDNKRNKDGYLLSTLSVINLEDNSVKSVTQSEQIQVANWLGNRLVYIQIASGTSASDPNRQRLMSYDYKISDNRQLASSNYFNDILTAVGKIYYAPSSTFQPNASGASLFRMNADSTSKQTVLPQEAWNIFRTSYDKLIISVPNSWYEYTLDASAPVKLEGQPSNITSRVYVDSPDGKRSLWVDNRDGKGVVLLYGISDRSEKVLRTQSGLKNPIRWLSDQVIVYRINTDQETADYALSLDGGEPIKIRDVTNTGGVDKWYYYN